MSDPGRVFGTTTTVEEEEGGSLVFVVVVLAVLAAVISLVVITLVVIVEGGEGGAEMPQVREKHALERLGVLVALSRAVAAFLEDTCSS
jgi:hypothetical protein